MVMRENILRLIQVVCYMCMITVLTACSSVSWMQSPTTINSQILASFEINPDTNGRPSPLVVRVYELKSISAFNDADFFKLYDEEVATLGGDLLSREEFELTPGEGREIAHKANEQSRYFAVVAAFRNIDQASWRASAALELNSKNSLIVRIDKQSVTINNR
jgi:type VI secretion system protein VasD